MKKLFFLAVLLGLCGAWPAGLAAQGISKGDQMVSIFAGIGGATNETALPWDLRDDAGEPLSRAKDFGWGDESVSFGAQYLYALNPYWALGAEYHAHFFDGSTDELHGFGPGGQRFKATVDQDMDVHSVMLAGRFTVNPHSSWRLYVPFGAGVSFAKATINNSFWETDGSVSHAAAASQSNSSSSFTYYIGAGLEHPITDNWLWGLEGRYQSFSFDYGKFASEAGRENLHHVTVSLKLGYRL